MVTMFLCRNRALWPTQTPMILLFCMPALAAVSQGQCICGMREVTKQMRYRAFLLRHFTFVDTTVSICILRIL